jgi:hypothetical protein
MVANLRRETGTYFNKFLALDMGRAFEDTVPSTVVDSTDFSTCKTVLERYSVEPRYRVRVNERLVSLGEKCVHMSDPNCSTCLVDRNWLCLRSLVGRYFKHVEIMAHKGIELYDLFARSTTAGRERRIWGFAKLPDGKSDKGLTLRNKPGAVLFAQVCAQIDRTTFDTVMILTPAAVNQDFKERLEVICTVFNKSLCFIALDELGRMLVGFEDEAAFEGVDPEKIYSESKRKRRPSKGKTLALQSS